MSPPFVRAILQHLRDAPNGALLREMHGNREVPVDNRHLLQRITAVQGSLHAHAVKAGDCVVLIAPNSANWVAADLAILAAGCVVVPFYTRQGMSELQSLIPLASPALVITTPALADALRPESKVPVLTLAEACQGAGATEAVAETPGVEGSAATMIFTSGTSGVAKGVPLTAEHCGFMLERTASALRDLTTFSRKARRRPPRAHDRVFHYLPFCFAGSRILLWTCLSEGNPIWISTDLDALRDELQGAAPHLMLNVPFLLERIRHGVEEKIQKKSGLLSKALRQAFAIHCAMERGTAKRRDRVVFAVLRKVLLRPIRKQIGDNFEALLCGSAPLNEDTQRWFGMLGIPVLQIYGLTETTAIVTMDRPGNVLPGFVGKPIHGVDIKISPDGELWVKGPNVLSHYHNRPDATAEAIEDGWFKTGDLVETSKEGHLRILGRSKNVLVLAAGHNVAPEPLEARLLQKLPEAEHIVLIGHGRAFLSALVTGTDNRAAVTAAIESLNTELPHYKRIRKHHLSDVAFSPENGLLTANQKLRRQEIEARFASVLERLYGTRKAGPRRLPVHP